MVYSPVQAPLSSPLDDAHSMLKYEIEVVNLQFNVEAETAQVCAVNTGVARPSLISSVILQNTYDLGRQVALGYKVRSRCTFCHQQHNSSGAATLQHQRSSTTLNLALAGPLPACCQEWAGGGQHPA